MDDISEFLLRPRFKINSSDDLVKRVDDNLEHLDNDVRGFWEERRNMIFVGGFTSERDIL